MTGLLFTHPWLGGLLGDEEIGALFSPEAELRSLLAFEAALAEAEAEEGLIEEASAEAIRFLCMHFEPDWQSLREGVARDGVVMPALLRGLRQELPRPAAEALHFGATSQDAIDSGLAVRLLQAADVLDQRLWGLALALEGWDRADGSAEVLAHTRMQAARTTCFGRKLSAWRDPLLRNRQRLVDLRPRFAVLRFGGAVGDRAEMKGRGGAVADRLAGKLGLSTADTSLHSERDGIAEFGSWLSLVTGTLGKFGQDVVLATQSEVAELTLIGGGGSSAMAHKNNPVGAEVLVTLGRFNATLLGGLHQAVIHENERSGAAWTLEWMLLPQMCVAAGAATRIAADLIERLSLTAAGKEAPLAVRGLETPPSGR